MLEINYLPNPRSHASTCSITQLFRLFFGAPFRKLGLFSTEDDDEGLFESLFATMADTSADFTGTFRELAKVQNGHALQYFPHV